MIVLVICLGISVLALNVGDMEEFITRFFEGFWKIPLYDIKAHREYLKKMVDDYGRLVALDKAAHIHNEAQHDENK
jgi:hypothetical protein